MTQRSLPTRRLPARPDLDQLKRQAKELLDGFRNGDAEAATEVHTHYREATPAAFALHDAQLTLARAYGFESWPKLKAFVEGATVRELVAAIRAADEAAVRDLLKARPELAALSTDNMGMLHHAILVRHAGIVRLLMQHGANARDGIYPYREATTAHAVALARGDAEIVAIIEEEESRRRESGRGPAGVIEPSPLHRAAFSLDAAQVRRLLDDGADPNARALKDLTPLDAAAHRWYQPDTQAAIAVIRLLLERGARMTPAAAVVLDDVDWLRARVAEGPLDAQVLDTGGLLRIAVTHDRSHVLTLLLQAGLDPDERIRVGDGDEVEFSWGMALQAAVGLRRYEMARALLEKGADPNARIMASGDPMMSAHTIGDARMIALLEEYGGVPTVTTAGLTRNVDLARRMLAGEAPYRLDGVGGGSVAEQLLWGAADVGEPAIVRLVVDRVEWPRDDPRWFTVLEQTLRHDSTEEGWEERYLECFRLLLARCDPNLRGRETDNQQFGITPLHNIVARGNLADAERVAFASAALEAGARLDIRDNILCSTPLGWAARWGKVPLVRLFIARGADPAEPDSSPWARPRAWAERMGRPEVLGALAGRR